MKRNINRTIKRIAPIIAIIMILLYLGSDIREKQIYKKINNYRINNNITEVTEYDKLSEAAEIRAEEIYKTGVIEHTRPDGSDFSTVCGKCGIYKGNVSEIIASGYILPASALKGWKNSESHNECILTPKYKYVGIGVYNNVYVCLFLNNDT